MDSEVPFYQEKIEEEKESRVCWVCRVSGRSLGHFPPLAFHNEGAGIELRDKSGGEETTLSQVIEIFLKKPSPGEFN